MFGMGPAELVVIAVIVVLIFGAAKIPELGRGIGEGIANFKKGLRDGDTPSDTALHPDIKVTDIPKKPDNT